MQMLFKNYEKVFYYAIALLLGTLVTLIKLDFPDIGTATPFLLYIFVVIVSAYIGGLGPGLFALGFTGLLSAYFFLHPVYSLRIEEGVSQFRFGVYTIEGILTVLILGALRTVKDQLIQANKHLEERVKNRTKELRLTMNEMLKLNDELKRSNRELEDFAYIASHDLQEPLRKIQSFGNLLADEYVGKLDNEGKMYIERIVHSSKRMRHLIEDLLMYSRVTTKGAEFQDISLNKILHDVVSDMDMQIQQADAQVHIDELPTVKGDETQLYQVFQNLISNALRYRSDKRHPVIQVYSEIEGHFYKIYMRDNGIGFDEKYKDRIFNIFERLHGRQQFQGTGIGLAIVKKITRRHNGSVDVTSKPDKGATFIISLPTISH